MSRPILRYFGGKWLLAPWIIEHFPPHKVYVEPYGGGASVLMRKPRSYAEVYNDLESEVVNVFRVLRDEGKELERHLRLTPFSREEFEASYRHQSGDIGRARMTIVRSFMGFGSNSVNRDSRTGFRANSNRSGTTPAHGWANYPDEVPAFVERLQGVVIENREATEVMLQQDSPETLFFVDPPYVQATRSVKHGYRVEMDDDQHLKMCAVLRELKGMVLLCGYDNLIYAGELQGWATVSKDTHADGARDRTEVLWMNPAAWNAQKQGSFL